MTLKVIDKSWFTNRQGTFGIVLAQDTITNERKAYIGLADQNSEPKDVEEILAWGAKFPVAAAEALMGV